MKAKTMAGFFYVLLLCGSVYALPAFQIFEGIAKIDGSDAPEGTVIEAYIQGDEDPDLADGNVTLESPGEYQIIVNGEDTHTGNTIEFISAGATAHQTAEFLVGGSLVSLNLTFGETTTTISGECPLMGDTEPCDGTVSDFELLDYIDGWASGEVADFDLLAAIDNWAS